MRAPIKSTAKASTLFLTTLMATNNIQASDEVQHMSSKEPIILINPFTVPKSELDNTVKSWESARDFLSQQPGYISTELHQSLSPNAEYRLINVAKWRSAEEFKAATAAMQKNGAFPPIEGVTASPALYKVIRN